MRLLLLAGMTVAVLTGTAHAKRVDSDTLLRIIAPLHRGDAAAHPFVNVVIRFGATSNKAPADPATFKARVGSNNITSQFEDEFEGAVLVGKRARLGPPFVQAGRRLRLRLSVRSVPKDLGKKRKRTYTDGDVLRFRAVEAANQQPVAQATRSTDIILPSIPLQFDATQSQDPEGDTLQYQWDFGDGTTSTERRTKHAYDDSASARVVRLTVSDGQATSAPIEFAMIPEPPCDAGALPGLLKVESETQLEFGPVPVGTSATRTITVRNVDLMPGTQVRASLGADSGLFTIDPAEIVLGPGESMPVTITFQPTSVGHQSARLGAVACTIGQNSIGFLTHGYGGDAPGTGPTFAHDTSFYSGIATSGVPRFGIFGIQPNGQRFAVDNSARWCLTASNTGTRDLCFRDGDCQTAGEQCVDTTPLNIAFDPSDFCSDHQGNVFILSEDTVLDPVGDDNEVTGTIARIKLDEAGNRIGEDVVRRVTGTTSKLACDDIAASDGGLLYMAEYRAIVLPGNCIRDAEEAFTGVHKGNGTSVDFGVNRIDALEVPPKSECDDDYDPVQDLAVSANGNQVFFIPEDGGIYRLRPTPLYLIQGSPLTKVERVQIHPDGAVLYATAVDSGSTGTILLYKIFPEQAENGALRLEDLTPCASFPVPNNLPPGETNSPTVILSFAAERSSAQDGTSTVVVSFGNSSRGPSNLNGPKDPLAARLHPQGSVSFSSAEGSPTCTANGLINLEQLDMLTF